MQSYAGDRWSPANNLKVAHILFRTAKHQPLDGVKTENCPSGYKLERKTTTIELQSTTGSDMKGCFWSEIKNNIKTLSLTATFLKIPNFQLSMLGVLFKLELSI